jgi:hypothetical protein
VDTQSVTCVSDVLASLLLKGNIALQSTLAYCVGISNRETLAFLG